MDMTVTKAVGLSFMLFAAFGLVAPALGDSVPSLTGDATADIQQNCVDTGEPLNSGPPCCVWFSENSYICIY